MTKAIDNFNNVINPALIKSDLNISDQAKIDELLIKLNGTDNKSKLGANSILAASIAFTKASAAEKVKYRWNLFLLTSERQIV